MLGLTALSGLAFPLGFFSPIRTQIAQLLPTHYAGVMIRSMMLKGTPARAFLDWIAVVAGLWLLSLVGLKGAVVYYRRTA